MTTAQAAATTAGHHPVDGPAAATGTTKAPAEGCSPLATGGKDGKNCAALAWRALQAAKSAANPPHWTARTGRGGVHAAG